MKPNPITQTGIKGFLLWFAREQPHIYNKIAPKLPAIVPKAFSNYTSRQNRLREIYKTGLYNRTVQRGQLGDFYELPTLYSTAPAIPLAPVTVDYTANLSVPTPSVDYTASVAPSVPIDTTGVPFDTSTIPNLPPVASAANTGMSATPIANAIGQTIGAASSILLTNQQAALQQQIVQSQLARAQAGLPPLNTSLNQLGVPTVGASASVSGGALMLLGIAAVAVLALSGGNKKSA